MPSGEFIEVPLDRIIINREVRQRRELPNIPELADSIRRLGLINPVTIDRNYVLVAGERRLEAIRSLGWTDVTCQFADADDVVSRAIELEENVKRVDLPWIDHAKAVLEYHEFRQSEKADWRQEDTGAALGYTQAMVSKLVAVAQEANAGNKRVLEAPKLSVAIGVVSRVKERARGAEVEKVNAILKPPPVAATPGSPAPKADPEAETILNMDFTQWAPKYSGPRFNLVHCDFPYGIGADSFAQGAAAAHGGYVDDEQTYWTLCQTLASNIDRLLTPSAHIMFWFSMKYYSQTLAFFERNTDFVIEPFPLIWMKSDNVGILPDPQRGPRRIYETAFLGRRGDRKIVQAVANAYAAPTVRDRHMSEKPETMLRHFFRMLVDDSTVALDPTCGSGSAIRAAESLKCRYALGLERDPEFADRARHALKLSRQLRKGATNGTE